MQNCPCSKDSTPSYPFQNFHRGLDTRNLDVNSASQWLYSAANMGRYDPDTGCGSCVDPTVVDEYSRVVGYDGVKASWGGCVPRGSGHSAEERILVETATRPAINHFNCDSFDNLRLGRDLKDAGLSRQVSCGMPQPRQAKRQHCNPNVSAHRRVYN